jgi:DNA-binding MarR family transcriptional regulator
MNMSEKNSSNGSLFNGRDLDDADGEKCIFCGFDNDHALEEHHVIPRRVGGPDTSDNLITVCANCHNTLESVYDNLFWARVGSLQFSLEDLNIDVSRQSDLSKFDGGSDVAPGLEVQDSDDTTEDVGVVRSLIKKKTKFEIIQRVYRHDGIQATQGDLADCIGYSQQYISGIVNGRHIPDENDDRIKLAYQEDTSIFGIEREAAEQEARSEILNTLYEHEEIVATQTALAECTQLSKNKVSRILKN